VPGLPGRDTQLAAKNELSVRLFSWTGRSVLVRVVRVRRVRVAVLQRLVPVSVAVRADRHRVVHVGVVPVVMLVRVFVFELGVRVLVSM
jgi:hypothetical protein